MSLKESTSSDSAKQAAIREIMEGLEKSIARAEVMEGYYSREAIFGNKQMESMLGRTQSEIKQQQKLHDYLQEKLDK